jgi:hypothetical protein
MSDVLKKCPSASRIGSRDDGLQAKGGSQPSIAADAVEAWLVTSLGRPGGNLTGINSMNVGLGAKRFELPHELAWKA